ncbi:hypothetical protein EYF80_033049 [Liparis tanakae]|uniref:Uncharacterized protein n=1 Tax=Liparis tanakae TaxID=230148 RepID=A0A4Z2GVW0_9TELE|nr:hypothetical protein EYF80_033049 [Liparis tanakae]
MLSHRRVVNPGERSSDEPTPEHLGRRQPANGRRAARDLENSLNSHRSPPAGPWTDRSVSFGAKGLKHATFLRCPLASASKKKYEYECRPKVKPPWIP